MPGQFEGFRVKARESLLAAQSERNANRFDPALALAYYAAYQIGIAVFVSENMKPPRNHQSTWMAIDTWVVAEGRSDLKGVVGQMYGYRKVAQYQRKRHSNGDAQWAISKATEVLDCLSQRLDRLSAPPAGGVRP